MSKEVIIKFGNVFYKSKPIKYTDDKKVKPQYDIDMLSRNLYREMAFRLYSGNAAFVSACENNYLCASYMKRSTLFDNYRMLSEKTDAFMIGDYIAMIYDMLWAGESTRMANFNARHDEYTIILQQKQCEDEGYFRLSENSDTFPGTNIYMSNFIVDTAAALYRINRCKQLEHRYFSKKYLYPLGSISKLAYKLSDIAELKDGVLTKRDNPKVWKMLDFKKCMLGDIEYLMNMDNVPIFATLEGSDELLLLCNDIIHKDSISPAFTTPMRVVTNPDVIMCTEKAKFLYGKKY